MIRHLIIVMAMIFTTSVAIAQNVSDPIITQNYNESNVNSNTTSSTTLKSPPPSAISPSINSSNSDLCTIGVSGAVQTQILGISAGKTVRDMNCEKLKNAKTLYDMGMKVAAVSVMCQDERVFRAMMDAGTPCPYDGLIGDQAKAAWLSDQDKKEDRETNGIWKGMDEDDKSTAKGIGGIGALLALLLLL